MKRFLTAVVGLGLIFASHTAEAQNHWSLDVRGGVAHATQDLGDATLDMGFGFEGTVAYRFRPHWSAYAGWGWTQFSADDSFAGSDVHFEETGYTFGLEFRHPLGSSGVDGLIRAGGLYNHIEVESENAKGEITADSGHGLGWQVGVGLAIPLGQRWSLTPEVRYRSLSRDLEIAGDTTAVDLSYLSTSVGLAWSF